MDKLEYSKMAERISELACDKLHYVETKNYGTHKGVLVNYWSGNVVLLTLYGICHFPYSEVRVMKPLEYKDEKLNELLRKVCYKEEENNKRKYQELLRESIKEEENLVEQMQRTVKAYNDLPIVQKFKNEEINCQ